ncbi:MAG: CDP-alcohol phosphatidyltransferase family protein [Nitrospirota bacterium]|nr:CDP-alcohol phosphatidyltransferase family protein [Nitrospirota bacterium]
MNNQSTRKHFSMIREFHLADFFTLANAACGMGAVLFSMFYMGSRSVDHFFAAAALVAAALVFDTLDGRIARWRHKHSALGRELDSLADIISFGVAPATLGFAAGLCGGWDWIALLYFVCCGVSRLARFNVTAESLSEGRDAVAYFEGTPIPTSVVLSGILALAAWQGRLGEHLYWGAWSIGPWDLHPLVLLFVLSGTLMVSKTLRIPKF